MKLPRGSGVENGEKLGAGGEISVSALHGGKNTYRLDVLVIKQKARRTGTRVFENAIPWFHEYGLCISEADLSKFCV